MKYTINVEKLTKYITAFVQRMQENAAQYYKAQMREAEQHYKAQMFELSGLLTYLKTLDARFGSGAPAPETMLDTALYVTAPQLLETERSNDDINITFTQKELMSMPKQFRQYFMNDGRRHKVRRRQTGKNSFSYNIRYRRDGHDIDVSSTNLEEAKKKFIAALNASVKRGGSKDVSSVFNEFGQYFFDNYYVEKVAKETYRNNLALFKRWIVPHFEDLTLGKITPAHCKDLLEQIKAKGFGKTADDVHSILNQILKYAIAFGQIQRNPLAVVPHKQHKRENGVRLSIEDENKLLTECRPNYKLFFAIYLYCGIRPSEIYTVRFENGFVVCQNMKQHEQEYVEKKIPIIKKLQPYLQDIAELPHVPKLDNVRKEFNKILANHTLKDCRRTFSSHCVECGVNENVRDVAFLGHAPKRELDRAYVEYSDEFLLSEAAKIDY
ncbi:MAG: site-specific integrase [Corallococcus sp.]|nr:site-specific integrase [Corallococcus sp.]MCM1359089.1 site-specific integrase [Corallococcus sp.]MCM1395078.1 site-specific integrase [Corallococcus sp.]